MPYATNSSGNYSGTIVVSPIRPANPNSNVSTALSNEIKGSHHTYETIVERNSIIESRREWGMLCTVYNDPISTNNKTFILKYGFVSTNILDNSNWIEFVTGATNFVPTGGEWINSVQIISSTPSVFTDGYRYLISSGGIGQFSGQDWKIAQYNSVGSTFSFVTPTEGMTVRVDNEKNVVYKYQGTYSTGIWMKEYLNQVRYLNAYSTDGMSYSATSSQTPLMSYNDSVYVVNFNMTSSGTVSLNIDSIGFINVKKLENNTFNFIGNSEIVPGIQYKLVSNSGFLQTVLPSSTTTTIGSAEDGTYTDGLFTDFNPSTPIGVAIDRINEALRILIGLTGTSMTFSGPTLSSWSATSSFVNGGISFDSSTLGFIGATGSPYGAVLKGGTFSNLDSPYRLGIRSKVLQPITGTQFYQDISGVFNSNVVATTNYPANSFNYASSGTFSLFLNGITISSVGLSSTGSIDTTSSGATSGLVFSPVSTVGITLPELTYRTGSYLIKRDDFRIVEGYNFFVGRHDFGGNSFVLPRYEFIADGDTSSISSPANSFNIISGTNRKSLSGITYFARPYNIIWNISLSNVISNTFDISSSAVTFYDNSYSTSSTNNVTNSPTFNSFRGFTTGLQNQVFTLSDPAYPNGTSSKPLKIQSSSSFTPATVLPFSITYSVGTSVRRINDDLNARVIVKRTVQGTQSFANSTGSLFIDTTQNESTDQQEYFSDEVYRKRNGTSKYDTTLNNSNATTQYAWSSTQSIRPANPISGYDNGLQVVNSCLIYPKFDFSTVGTIQSNPNFGIASRNYSNLQTFNTGFGTSSTSSATNYRTYTRYIRPLNGASNISSWQFTIEFVLTNFVNAHLPLSGNNVWLEFRCSDLTGWMDMTKNRLPSQSDTNGDGCLTQLINPVAPLVTGTGSSASRFRVSMNPSLVTPSQPNPWTFIRITAGPDWNGRIMNIYCQS